MRRERLYRNVLWRSIAQPGYEYCSLWGTSEGWQMDGTIITVSDGAPLRVRYAVVADSAWRTRNVYIETRAGKEKRALKLSVDDEGRWWRSSEELDVLTGCIDVDLGVTPCTNTVPIRRLQLTPGQSTGLRAARVQFPSLAVSTLQQRYTRLDESHYVYESPNGSSPLHVDELGLVLSYGDRWERVASST